MNPIVFFILFGFVSSSFELFCSKSCSTIQTKRSSSFIEPSTKYSCTNDSSTNICKGRVVAYYNDKTYPKYINYTLGKIADANEQDYQNQIEAHGLLNLIKYQVIINPKIEETQIIADIYCTNNTECALIKIKNLFQKYRKQINPLNQLKSLIYSDIQPKTLVCYDSNSETNIRCPMTTDQNKICTSYSKQLKQECKVDNNLSIYVEFICPLPYTIQLDSTHDLVNCNVDNCNDHRAILLKIRDISRDYAYGKKAINNHAKKEREGFYRIFSIILFSFSVRFY